ncbi:hypothetical protein RHS02_04432, partial [Rhizoctonia solani]
MVYPANALSLSLLLGAGGVMLSAAATLPCSNQCTAYHKEAQLTSQLNSRNIYKRWSRSRRSTEPEASSASSILDDLVGSSDGAWDGDSEHGDSHPDDPALATPPIGIDLGAPFDSAVGWLNADESIHSVLNLEGELDLIAHSHEKPRGVKVGTLGYVSNSTAHNPFELLSEAEAGGIVFLTLPELATDQMEGNLELGPSASFSNHSAAILAARTYPLGLDLLSNLNLTDRGSVDTSREGQSASSGFVYVLIKAGTPSNSDPPSSLCATFYAYPTLNHNDDDTPMFLEKCDRSLVPGAPTNTANTKMTQLWQYDPKTRELKPAIQGDTGVTAPLGVPNSNGSDPSLVGGADSGTGVQYPSGTSSSIERTRTADTQPSEAIRKLKSDTSHSTTQTYPSPMTAPAQIRARKSKSGRTEGSGSLLPAYKTIAIVDPYTLVFAPRSATDDETALPDSPAQ